MTGPFPAPLLEMAEISAHVEGAERPLLQGVGLTVLPGEVVAVVGPSGSGKTTLGLAALGASHGRVRLSGRALLEGTDLVALPSARRRSARAGLAAHLPQHPESVLDPVRRVGGVLTELAALGDRRGRTARKAAAARALTAAGLDWKSTHRRFPHQLSGGQQQRLALASVLVTGARLLVLDEPTSGLDPVLGHALGRTVRRLADEGAGVLLLSHDLPLVRRTADRVVVLDHGRVVDDGPADEVLGAGAPAGEPTADGSAPPRHPATRKLIVAEHRTSVARRAAPGAERPDPRHPGGVEAHEVAVRRRSTDPLAGPVSMAFPPGSSTALLGPSGSGKTTFGRVLAGLATPTSGEIRNGGTPLPARIDRRTTAQRRIVQYVHQNSADSFEGRRPLFHQLADTACLLRGLDRAAAVAEVLASGERLGLDESVLRRTPGGLSGGQLQRCALVRALAAHPALLVCDEVTSSLDTASRELLLEALPELLAPADTALLFISHDLPAVRAVAEDVVEFENGTVRARGGRTE